MKHTKKTKSITTKDKTKKKLPKSAITDHLTSLYNRRHFDKSLRKIISDSKKEHKHFSLLMMDIDKFKLMNDRYGHLVGDKILTDLAKVLKKLVRRVDICFRYGGDEITIILPDAEKKAAENIVMRLKTKVERHKFAIEGEHKLSLKLSIGLAVYPDDGLKSKALIKKADALLYKAKRQKRRIAEPFILKTKLVPPILKETEIFRPRLLSLLKQNLTKKLILVNADAGYGKTTLLAQTIKEIKTPCIWYQIDRSDQELDIFMRYLVEGMRRYIPEFGKRTLNVINQSSMREIELEILIGTFINELLEVSEKKISFIFDDLQEIYESKRVVSGLEYLLTHLPPNVLIIIAARSNPPFSLERLHLKNETLNIDQKDLKFNKDEIKILCKQIGGYTPKPAELKELDSDSEGWITSLQFLVPLTKQKSTFAKSKKSLLNRLNDYFDKEVFSPLENNLKLFLTATSVFEYLSPEACDFLLSKNDSEQVLRNLQKRHLFVSAYDAPEPSYRYHHLFRDFLAKKLGEFGLYHKFQNKAGVYWEKKSIFPTAVQHYFEGKNYKSIARLIEKVGDEYITLGKVKFIKHYIEHLPETIINNSPTLIRFRGRICFWNCDWENAKSHYSKAKRLARYQKNYLEIFKTLEQQLVMRVHLGEYKETMRQIRNVLRSKKLKSLKLKVGFLNILGLVFFFNRKIKEAIEVYEEMLKISKRISDNRQRNTALINLSLLNLVMGNLTSAQNYLETLTVKQRANPSPELISALISSANLLMTQGYLDKSKEILEEAQKYAQLFNDRKQLCVSYFYLGLVAKYEDELEQAEQLLNKAEKLSLEIGYKFVLSGIWDALAELALNRGDFLQAKQRIEKSLKLPIPSITRTSHLITKAKIELSLRNVDAAEKTLNQALPNLKELKHLLIGFYLQLGRFYLLKKDEIRARTFINKSITLAEKNSFDFLLLYELKPFPEIIRFAKRIGFRSHYFQNLLLKLPYSETNKILVEPEMDDYDFVVRLFDKIQIFRAGKEIKPGSWRTKGLQGLFSFFVANYSRTIALEKIIYTFWPDHNPKNAKRLFHVALHWIRRAVDKDIIIFNKAGYTLSPKYKYWIDVQEFENLSKEGDRLLKNGNRAAGLIKYEEALSLYRGGFMDDFYGNWCQQKRLYFEGIYLNILKKLSDGHYKIGNYEKAIKFFNLFVNKNPYYEEMYCLAMRCYAALNDLGGVQNCFSNLKRTLAKDLKTVPRPDTVKLFEILMKQRKT